MRYSFLFLFVGFWSLVSSVTAQNEPVVVTDGRYARGATMAFGRIESATVNGSKIKLRGFCCATHPNPTYDDIRSSSTLTRADKGTICVLKDLQPATIYYMRAYAKAANGSIGYGKVIKFCTLPMGSVTYSYNNGGSAAENTRINNALAEASDIFNNLTSIRKHFNVGYSSGTPTADCNYTDTPWMNVGANSSYQRTGTIMHEMQHGLGVIPYSTQWSGDIMRTGDGTGNWIGERTSAFLDFWDFTTGSYLHGDTQHMWPYGINGASEDDGSLWTYYANAMIGQALGEDGLEHDFSTFAAPCYIFNQEDSIKYYLMNEDADCGLNSSFLVTLSSGALRWKEMTSGQAMQNDSAAWYITFTPENQYYQLRNAATGKYITYSSGFKTITRSKLTSNENFHLMKGRVNVESGGNVHRGYWLIHPSGNWSPQCLAAKTNGSIASQAFDLQDTATKQRWLILAAADIQQTSAVNTPQITSEGANSVYDLQGRRVVHPAKGLYIINGKKTVVR